MQLKLGRGCYLDYIVIIIKQYSIIYTYSLVESRSVSSWLYSPWGCPARRGCRWCEVSGRGTLSTHYLRRRMEAASYGEYRVVLHTTCFRLQLHQIGAVSCYDRCWVHHRCRNLAVPELQVAPNRSRHPNAIMRLEPKVILTVVLRLNVTSLSNMKSPF